MKNINFLLVFILIVVFFSFQITAQESSKLLENSLTLKKIESNLDLLKQALNEQNYGLVEEHFDEDFTYGNFGCGAGCSSSSSIMKQVVAGYPLKVEDIQIKKITRTGPDIQLLTSFHFEDKEVLDQEMLLTQELKFLEMELPGIQLKIAG